MEAAAGHLTEAASRAAEQAMQAGAFHNDLTDLLGRLVAAYGGISSEADGEQDEITRHIKAADTQAGEAEAHMVGTTAQAAIAFFRSDLFTDVTLRAGIVHSAILSAVASLSLAATGLAKAAETGSQLSGSLTEMAGRASLIIQREQ